MTDIENIYELTPVQEGMLYHTLCNRGVGVYNVTVIWHLRGDLDRVLVEKAWKTVMDRHGILRTAFHWEDMEKPLQVVHRDVPVPISDASWPDLPEVEFEDRLMKLRDEEFHTDFELTDAPLFRLIFIDRGTRDYRLIWTFHHILSDGWSTDLIRHEFLEAYESLCSGDEFRRAHPPQFVDYIEWLQEQDLDAAKGYWRDSFAGVIAPTPLWEDATSSAAKEQQAQFSHKNTLLSPKLSSDLHSLAKRCGVTVSTLWQAAWGLLLCRFSGETDVVFGCTVSGRPPELPGVESIVGLFINTTPVRVQTRGGERLDEFLSRLSREQVEARQYDYAPLVEIQRSTEVPNGVPLFESILVLQNGPTRDASRLGRHIEFLNLDGHGLSHYPIELTVQPTDNMAFIFISDQRRVDDSTAEQTVEQLITVLEQMVENPTAEVESLTGASNEIQSQLTQAFNADFGAAS